MKKREPSKKNTVIPNPELERVLKGWVPVFGNTQDMALSKQIESLRAKLPMVDNEILRGTKKEAKRTALTVKMREINTLEASLIYQISKRNMDF